MSVTSDIYSLFEADKASVVQFDIRGMLKFRVSDDIISEISEVSTSLGKTIVDLADVHGRDDVLKLQSFVSAYHKELGFELSDMLRSEIKEIIQDYKWINSKQGILVLQIEDWIENARKVCLGKFPHVLCYIGRSLMDPTQLIIGGYVESELQRLKDFFQIQHPPVGVDFKLKICVCIEGVRQTESYCSKK